MSTELSGVDLARQALFIAREAARKNGAARMVAPAAGGSVLARFDAFLAAAAPELAGHVQVVAFDADTSRLDVAPGAPAYGTKLRWSAPNMVAAANEKVQGASVRTLHVLAPAPMKAGPATAGADPTPPTVPAAPVQRRTPPDGYRRAIEAHRQAARPSTVDPAIAGAVERQTTAMRELSRRAFPEPDVVPDAPASIEVSRAQRRRQAEATEAAARRCRRRRPEPRPPPPLPQFLADPPGRLQVRRPLGDHTLQALGGQVRVPGERDVGVIARIR
ncbi:DUF721 domain-containing protein [Streptomyces sp. NPDC023327]|uniref:DUF721 domain-containing protein n=1 Tax=Streptomyces sp. NPDC023327 TaxID=3157088 RepID=UPI0033C1E279